MTDTTEEAAVTDDGLHQAPADADDDRATGYAVYNRTLGQFVGPVFRPDKPSASKAKSLAPKGHTTAIVRV